MICRHFQTKLATYSAGEGVQAVINEPKNFFGLFGRITNNMALHSSSARWQQQQTSIGFANRGSRPIHRLGCAPHRSSSFTVNVATAQQLGLGTRTTASILWDLDNVCPASPRTSLLPAIQEVKDLLLNLGLHITPSVTCYANMTTTRALSEQPGWPGVPLSEIAATPASQSPQPRLCVLAGHAFTQQLALAGVVLHEVRPKQQAADVRLSSDAVHLAQAEQAAGCVVVVTNDKGFAPVLAYCTSVGMATILVTSLPSPKYMPAALPDPRRHQLAAICTAAVPLQRDGVHRSPLPSYAHLWHALKSQGGGFLEPWIFIRPEQQHHQNG